MPWWESDFAGSFNVRKMRPLARLMYRSLLQQAWHADKALFVPNDDVTLRLMADAPSPKVWAKYRDEILARFQKTEDGKSLFHQKSLREYERAVAEHEQKVFGGEQRWRGRQKQSTSSAPATQKQSVAAPISSQNYNQNHNQSISTMTLVVPKANDLGELDDSVEDGGHATDDFIDRICNAHPRLQKPVLTEQYVVNAVDEEIARGKTFHEAVQYLHERTLLYREITDQWPEDQKRYVVSSHEFFRSGEYRTDPKFWQKASKGGEQAQSLPTALTPEPARERIRKQLETERQAAQIGNGGVNA